MFLFVPVLVTIAAGSRVMDIKQERKTAPLERSALVLKGSFG